MTALDEAERRRRELEARVTELAKANQAQRMLLALRAERGGTVLVVLALIVALAAGTAIGALFLPRTESYYRTCR